MLITSRNNPLVKELAQLAKEPGPAGAFAEGYHLCREAFLSGLPVRRLVCTPQAADSAEGVAIVGQARAAGAPLIEVVPECYEKISRLQSPEGMAVEFVPPAASLAQVLGAACRVLVAAGVQDPGNAGALVRVAEAAGASGCVFLGGADVYGGKFFRASMGSAFRLPCVRATEPAFLAAVASQKVRLLVAQMRPGAEDFSRAQYAPPVAVCVGGEGGGVPPELAAAAAGAVYIPMSGRVESLNVAVAAGIILYRARQEWLAI